MPTPPASSMTAPLGFTGAEFEALARLLQTSEPPEARNSAADISRPNPSSIGPHELLPVKVAPPQSLGRGCTSDIWTEEEAACSSWADDVDDGREVPEFELRYKQCVSTADNYLGMSGKDPSSNCCEELLVLVQLPKAASAAEMELDVTTQRLCLSSAAYKLSAHLPHPVDSARGTAKWNSSSKVLTIALPIVREDE